MPKPEAGREDGLDAFWAEIGRLTESGELRRLSSALAGTDRDSHEAFLLQGEAYRYAMVQALNRLHVHAVRYQNDRDQRISADHWRALPRFAYAAPRLETLLANRVLPALALLFGWIAVLYGAALWCGRRLERSLA